MEALKVKLVERAGYMIMSSNFRGKLLKVGEALNECKFKPLLSKQVSDDVWLGGKTMTEVYARLKG